MAKVTAVCISREKGEQKSPVNEIILQQGFGIVGDAHADENTHRQVSLLDVKSIDKIKEMGVNVDDGAFAENIVTDGLDYTTLPVGTRLKTNTGVILEVTQIGKECHSGCAIFQQVGTCVMPIEGIFTKVIKSGKIKAGDEISAI